MTRITHIIFVAVISIYINRASAQDATKLIELAGTPPEKILEFEGETVRVKGYVDATNTNATGINFLDFKDCQFQCITFGRYAKDFSKPPSDLYKEKWIEVTGKIEKYRGSPQIKLTSPDQVTILDAPKPAEPVLAEAPAEKQPEPSAEVEQPKNPEPEPETAPEPEAKPTREVVDGIEAIDWRKYFPE